jgi:hypothetical protein
MTVYVAMVNDFPVGVALSREGANEICQRHCAALKALGHTEPELHKHVHVFELAS